MQVKSKKDDKLVEKYNKFFLQRYWLKRDGYYNEMKIIC